MYKGVTILIGGKGVLKIGATMGTVVIPFMKLETDEDFEKLNELGRNVIHFFAENALGTSAPWCVQPRSFPSSVPTTGTSRSRNGWNTRPAKRHADILRT